jgi:thioredoxin-like negative regulator of GroEL
MLVSRFHGACIVALTLAACGSAGAGVADSTGAGLSDEGPGDHGDRLGEHRGWKDRLDDADLAALDQAGRAIVEIGADWCGPCNQLAAEVLETGAIDTVARGALRVRIDFETPHGAEVSSRLGVIHLPTTVVLDRDGREVGRVEGYPGAEPWLEALADALGGARDLPALEAKAARGDPLDLGAYAEARLLAGPQSGVAVALAALAALVDGDHLAAATRAARAIGRYHLRVRRDAAAGLAHFDAMAARFAASPRDHAHFLYWSASALVQGGRRHEGSRRLLDWLAGAPDDTLRLSYALEFHLHHTFPPALGRPLLERLVAFTGWTAELHYADARLALAEGRRDEAVAAARRAVALGPESALYRNYLARIDADGP